MAKKKGNGKDDAAMGLFRDMLEELRGLKAAQAQTNDRLARLESGLAEASGEFRGLRNDVADAVRGLRADVAEGFGELSSRLDTTNALQEQRLNDMDVRIRKIEPR